jgi:hypothetical protein
MISEHMPGEENILYEEIYCSFKTYSVKMQCFTCFLFRCLVNTYSGKHKEKISN